MKDLFTLRNRICQNWPATQVEGSERQGFLVFFAEPKRRILVLARAADLAFHRLIGRPRGPGCLWSVFHQLVEFLDTDKDFLASLLARDVGLDVCFVREVVKRLDVLMFLLTLASRIRLGFGSRRHNTHNLR